MTFRGRFLTLWDDLRSSFWFLPTLMALASIVLSQLTLRYDRNTGGPILDSILFYTGSAEGARSILSTIASSMIGLGGVVFSMTLVTLSLAAQQFGARTLRSLVRDRANQAVLGVFISSFVFCLIILRAVRGEHEGGAAFVPQISMFVALVFALVGLLVLIYFIHHVAFVIQAPHVITDAGEDLIAEVGDAASGNWLKDFDQNAIAKLFQKEGVEVSSEEASYIRRIDYESLAELARANNVVFRVEKRSGDFALSGEAILKIFANSQILKSDSLQSKARSCFHFGSQRTQEQDLRFIIGQLLSVALLALSPAINNPVQALLCIDRLTEALKRFATMPERGDFLMGEDGQLAVVDRALTFDELFKLSFQEIRLISKSQLMVSIALLDSYRRLSKVVSSDSAKQTIEAEYQKLYTQTRNNFPDDFSADDI